MTTTIPAALSAQLRLMPAIIFAAAVAAMIATAPAAQALTEEQIQTQCAAIGGTYHFSGNYGGDRVSECCFSEPGTKLHCITYLNGDAVNANEPPPPPTRPLPPGAVNPGPPVVANQP